MGGHAGGPNGRDKPMSKHATNRREVRENGHLFRSSRRRDAYFRTIKEEKLAKREKNKMSKIGNYVVELQEAKINCPECEGEGKCTYDRFVPQGFGNDYGYFEDYITECGNCEGSGTVEVEEEEEEDA